MDNYGRNQGVNKILPSVFFLTTYRTAVFSGTLKKELSMNECNIEVVIPEECRKLDQNEEWVEMVDDKGSRKVRLHEYGAFYKIPGLYDRFYKNLNCQSPSVVCKTLKTQMLQHGQDNEPLRALDFGAGTGQVGEQLTRELECEAVIGLDIIPEAREEAERERPEVYDDYYILNMAEPTEKDLEKLNKWDFNALLTVAALGYGDICTKAFLNAYNLLSDDAWVAFNIKDKFLSQEDETGFADIMVKMVNDGFEPVESRRYCHRLSLAGEPLHYYVVVGKKNGDISID